ncbi:MAG: roadblock/LC7 domain-containing protein [Pseudomonadota bacterium]
MQIDPRLNTAAQLAVDQVMREVAGARAAVVSTEDGFEVASRMANQAETARLSAMASSMAALGAMAGQENHIGACSNVVIEADNGHIIMLQARRPQLNLVLSVVAGRDAIVGQMLYFSKLAARSLEQA